MFELLVPAGEGAARPRSSGDKKAYDLELRPQLMVRGDRSSCRTRGVEPDVWKIEGLDRREDCEKIVAAARRGGRDAGRLHHPGPRRGRPQGSRMAHHRRRRARASSASPSAAPISGTRWSPGARKKITREAGGRRDRPPLPRVRRHLREAARPRDSSQNFRQRSTVMQLGMIGLGRMGANMVRRLMQGRPRVRRLRHVAEGGRGAGQGEGDRRRVARRTSCRSSRSRARSG